MGLRLLESRDLGQLPAQLRRRLPARWRMLLPVMRVVARRRFAFYKVNLYEVGQR